jgi:hypothetical protein
MSAAAIPAALGEFAFWVGRHVLLLYFLTKISNNWLIQLRA